MKKLAVLSPRTNALMAESQSGSPEEMEFSKLFTDMAYGVLEGKMPDLLQSVVTFKVLEASVEENKAAGVFVVNQQGSYLYVPVILSGGKVKSPELFYVKDLDSFLPLSSEWLREMPKMSPREMGRPAEAPDTLSTDLDISALTQPPTSGKTAYASDSSFINPELVNLLETSPNTVKVAYSELLKAHPACLKAAYKYHGDSIIRAVKQSAEKTASSWAGYYILTPDSPLSKFAEAFGEHGAASAFSDSCVEGVVVQDFRKVADVPVETALPDTTAVANITEPNSSGVYKVLRASGEYSVAAVFRKPHSLWGTSPSYLVVFPNGDYSVTDKLTAMTTEEELPPGPLKKALEGEGAQLRQGNQILVKGGPSIEAVTPLKLKNVSGDKAAGMRALSEASGYSVRSVGGLPMKAPHIPKGENVAFVPDSFVSVPAGKLIDSGELVNSVQDLQRVIEEGVSKEARYFITVKNCGAGMYSLQGTPSQSKKDTLEKMAQEGLNLRASVKLLDRVPLNGTIRAAVVPSTRLPKLASIFGPSEQGMPVEGAMSAEVPMGGMPPGMGGMPPEMGGMPPEINPAFMNQAAGMGQEAFDAASVAALLQSPELTEIAANYMPALEKALDNLGRILLSVQMNESILTDRVGLAQYTKLESGLSQVLKGLGALIIDLNEQMTATQGIESGPSMY